MIRKVELIHDQMGEITAIFELNERRFIGKALSSYQFFTCGAKFASMVAAGVTKESIQPYLVIPEMKALWCALVENNKPALNTGDLGFCDIAGVRSAVKVGPVVGYRLRPKDGMDIIREVLDVKNDIRYDVNESAIEKSFEEGDSKARVDYAAAEIRKVLETAGIAEAGIVIDGQTVSVRVDEGGIKP